MFSDKRNLDTIHEDVLCAVVVLRELNEYGRDYDEKARIEIVEKARKALRNIWADTGADANDIEPRMMELLKTGGIRRASPRRSPG